MKLNAASLVSAVAFAVALCNLHALPTAADYTDSSSVSWSPSPTPVATELGDPVVFTPTTGENAVATPCPTTPAWTAGIPLPPAATPSVTTPSPTTIPWEATHPFASTHTDVATPCPTAGSAASSSASGSASGSDSKETVVHCAEVSVEGDATYCVLDSVCSGDGEQPAGRSCPRAGAVAFDDCLETLPSYLSGRGKCVAPVDAVCQKIKTGAWGCVWPASSSSSVGDEVTLDSTTNANMGLGVGGSSILAVTLAVVGGMAAVVALAALAALWVRRGSIYDSSDDGLESSDVSLESVVTPPSSARAAAFLRV